MKKHSIKELQAIYQALPLEEHYIARRKANEAIRKIEMDFITTYITSDANKFVNRARELRYEQNMDDAREGCNDDKDISEVLSMFDHDVYLEDLESYLVNEPWFGK